MRKLRWMIVAAAFAAVMIPAAAFGVSEDPDPPEASITKECTTAPDEITPGSTVGFKVDMEVTGPTDEAIDNTVYSDTWDEGLTLDGTPQASPGYVLGHPDITADASEEEVALLLGQPIITGNSITAGIWEYDSELEIYRRGMLTGGKVTVTYNMIISENATGTLSNTATFSGNHNKIQYSETAKAELTVITETPPETPPENPPENPPVVEPDPPVVTPPVVEPEPQPPVVEPDPPVVTPPVVEPEPQPPVVEPDPSVVEPDPQPAEVNYDSMPKTGDNFPAWLAKLAEILMIILAWLGL